MNPTEHYYAMIMAGGGGTRLWPMSRSDTPKQLLPLVEVHSMFKTSVQRLAPLFSPERIYIVTGRQYVEALRSEAPEVPAENFIAEPYGRDSGPAAALGITVIRQRDPQAVVAILTADHHIAYRDVFLNVLSAAHDLAQQDYIVTLGISPSYPSTAFGYIRRGEKLAEVRGFNAYHSQGFTEKPDAAKARAFLRSGEYSWNSGMFIWKAERAMDELGRQQPEMYACFAELAPAVDGPNFEQKLESIWERINKISIDFAVMEGAQKMVVIPVDIGWSDVGSWDTLYSVLPVDEFGNAFKGQAPHDPIIVDARNTLVYSDKLVVAIGVDNVVVVETDDVLLICHKDRTQEVREVVKHLQATQLDKYL